MPNKQLKSNDVSILEKLADATLHQTVKTVDRLSNYFERLLTCHERLVERVEKIEGEIWGGAPGRTDNQAEAPGTDKSKSDHHLIIVK